MTHPPPHDLTTPLVTSFRDEDYDEAKDVALRCPVCQYTDKFYVYADVRVTVKGSDYTTILDEDGDREYGSESGCHCAKCGHASRLGDFRISDQDDLTPTHPL